MHHLGEVAIEVDQEHLNVNVAHLIVGSALPPVLNRIAHSGIRDMSKATPKACEIKLKVVNCYNLTYRGTLTL